MNPYKWALIVPISHSVQDLQRCFESLQELDQPNGPLAVVFIDCRLTTNVDTYLQKIAGSTFSFELVTLTLIPGSFPWNENNEERILSRARNVAIQAVQADYYLFSEDDCTFEANWLKKNDQAISQDIGMVGGPDYLPEGLHEAFPKVLDCTLSSYLGAVGSRRSSPVQADWYVPRRVNMAINGAALKKIGGFSEEALFGAEAMLSNQMREIGYQVLFQEDNPVWHRRVTSVKKHLKKSVSMASEKLRLAFVHKNFFKNFHFVMMLAFCVGLALLSLLSLLMGLIPVLSFIVGAYALLLIYSAFKCTFQFKDPLVGLGIILFLPMHQMAIGIGLLRGIAAAIFKDLS